MSAEDAALAAYMKGDVDHFEDYAKEKGVNNQGFLRFSGNTGQWTVGDDVIEPESQFVFNMFHARRGWIGWSNANPIDKILMPIVSGEKPPREDQLPHIETPKQMDGWQSVVVIDVRDIEMEYPQMEVSLPAEHGGRPVNKLVKEFGVAIKKGKRDENGVPLVPVMALDSETIDTPGGIKYKPVFEIVEWLSLAELAELEAKAEENEANVADGDEVDEDLPEEPPTKKESAPKASFRSRRGGRK
jgi:hypothetical protein